MRAAWIQFTTRERWSTDSRGLRLAQLGGGDHAFISTTFEINRLGRRAFVKRAAEFVAEKAQSQTERVQ
jgi:hypothetical protein